MAFTKGHSLGFKKGNIPRNKGKKGFKHSQETREKISRNRKNKCLGSDNPRWNGGKRHTERGYIWVMDKNHPKETYDGYVYEHRKIMEKDLDRYLYDEEVVHHINGDKSDNRIENLMLFENHREHWRFHNRWNFLKKCFKEYPAYN